MSAVPKVPDTLRIVLFGAIDTGKSSLINALVGREVAKTSAVGGTTRAAAEHRLEGTEYQVASGDLVLSVVDTPGIAEVGGGDRAAIAMAAARRADLILFVVIGDMTDIEHEALKTLHDEGKPVLVVVNKTDQMTPRERQETMSALHHRLGNQIGPDNIVPVAAAPLTKLWRIDECTGTEEMIERSGLPDVTCLKARMLEIASREGRALKRLSEALSAIVGREHTMHQRRATAESKVEDFAVATALGVALNPIPLLDLAGSAVALGVLVDQLGKVYGASLTQSEIEAVAGTIWSGARSALAGVAALTVFGSLVKTLPGFGTAAGALMQAGAAGYMMTIAGKACITYLENGRSWGEKDPQSVLDDIIRSVDRASITARIVERVKQRMKA